MIFRIDIRFYGGAFTVKLNLDEEFQWTFPLRIYVIGKLYVKVDLTTRQHHLTLPVQLKSSHLNRLISQVSHPVRRHFFHILLFFRTFEKQYIIFHFLVNSHSSCVSVLLLFIHFLLFCQVFEMGWAVRRFFPNELQSVGTFDYFYGGVEGDGGEVEFVFLDPAIHLCSILHGEVFYAGLPHFYFPVVVLQREIHKRRTLNSLPIPLRNLTRQSFLR